MRRIAFIGIQNADSEVLHGALRRNLGADAEINAFERDVAAVTVAPFLVPKNKEGQLEGGNSVAYISSDADSDLAKKIGRLSKAGVTVRNGWSDFKPEAPEEEIGQWLSTGEWPEPEPEEEPEDDHDALMALLLGDEDEEDDDESPAPVDAFVTETSPVAADTPTATAAPETSDDEDELPVFSDPVIADVAVAPEVTYPSRRFDSMGANDGVAVEPVRRKYQTPAEPEDSFAGDEEDDDLPLPSFSSTQAEPAAEVPVAPSLSLPAIDEDEDDDDDLPAFGHTAPVAAPEFTAAPEVSLPVIDEEDDDLPAFTAAPVEQVSSDLDMSSFFDDEEDDDDLPAFSVAPKEEVPVAAREAETSFDDDDELPAFQPLAETEEEVRLPEPPSYARPNVDEFSTEPDVDDEDDLPMFSAPSAPVEAETRVGRRAARELPVMDEDEDDDLPAFRPTAPVEPVSEAPSYARAPIDVDEDDEDDLPLFSAPAPAVAKEQDDDFFSEEDSLPDFNSVAEAETEAPAPLRRSRRDFLKAAEALASGAPSNDETDDDGDDLPVFAPQFTAPAVDDDDELPAPARRATVASDTERGDDLPVFANRATKQTDEEEEDPEEEESFEFAPKVKTPRYAAPVDKQPAWGVPVQRPEPVAKPEPESEPVKAEALRPVKKVAPEAVRYADDVPSEAIALRAKRRRDEEGYRQPVIESDVPNRVLKAAPGEAPELRKAPKRVVNQRPAAPIEEEPLDFMAGPDTNDDFDPNATAPYMEALKPELRRAQSTMEQIRREYDSDTVMKIKSKGSAVCYYVTGSHGGAGKTTSTWMMANTMAAALKNDPLKRPVFLIEGDYENSKLAQRLNLPPEKNSGRLAEFFRKLSSDRSIVSKQKINMYEMTESIIKESVYVNDHGVNIIAAPYDLTKRDGRFLRIAIQKSVEYAERQGGFVFIDADTLSNDDILDRTLAAKATHVILVSFGDKDHVDDTHRAIHTLTTPNVKSVSNGQSTNGMGVPKDRIKLFFNKTGTERFEDLQRTMRPYLTEGHLPTVQGLNDGGWIGNLTGGDFLNAVTSYASFMNRVSPMEELRPYEQRRHERGTQRSGFMKMFGSRRG